MPYGTEAHTGFISYELELAHTSGIRLTVTADPFLTDGSTPSEALRDSVFQIFLTTLAQIPNTTVVSAKKRGQYHTPVTP